MKGRHGGVLQVYELHRPTCIINQISASAIAVQHSQLKACSHLPPFLWLNVRKRRILNYPPIQELHDIERGSDHSVVFTKAVGLRNRYVRLLKRMNDPILALDLVGCLGKEFSGRLFTENISVVVGVCDLVGWI